MNNFTKRKLIGSVKLGLATIPFILVWRFIAGGFLPGAILLGFGLGFAVGVAEFFILTTWFKDRPFGIHVLMKSFLLMVFMGATYAILNILDLIIFNHSWQHYVDVTFNYETLYGLLKLLGLFTFLLFFVQLDRLLGPGIMLKYVTGKYHLPQQEERIFMFMDLKGSTTLAGQMSGEKYFSFLQDYFSEMSDPMLETEAQVYQYVGDEIILTWPWKKGVTDNNCVKVFFLVKERISLHKDHFINKYGTIPEFKAGLHGGKVITAEIGDIKKEIVYNGDVLNTAARIQSKCNELERSFLVSSDVVKALSKESHYEFEKLGSIELKGKSEAVDLYAIQKSNA